MNNLELWGICQNDPSSASYDRLRGPNSYVAPGAMLLQLLQQNDPRVETIGEDIYAEIGLMEDGAVALAQALKANTTCRRIDLNAQFHLGKKGLAALRDAVEKCPFPRVLTYSEDYGKDPIIISSPTAVVSGVQAISKDARQNAR
jgi:hypothetical protein